MINDKTTSGYPIGRVANSIRKELYPDLTSHEVEAITIILLYHLIIENKINTLLYKCMGKIESNLLNDDLLNEVKGKVIEEITFSKKIKLIKPLAQKLWGKEHASILSDFYKVNDIRNNIFHRMKIKEVSIDGKLLKTEEGIEYFIDLAHSRSMNIDDLAELVEMKKYY